MILVGTLSHVNHSMRLVLLCHCLAVLPGCSQYVGKHGDGLPSDAVARMGSLPFRHGSGIMSISFSPDGRMVASAGGTSVKIWDVRTGRLLRTIAEHEDAVLSVSYSGGGDRLVSASVDHSVRVWEASSGNELRRILVTGGLAEGVYDVRATFSPNGQDVVTFAGDNTVRVWSLCDGKERVRLEGQAKATRPLYAAYSPDGKTLCWGGGDLKLRFFDLESLESTFELNGGDGYLQGISVSPKGGLVSLLCNGNTILVWNISSRSMEMELGGLDGTASMAFSPDGKLIASGGEGGRIRVWDIESGGQRTLGRLGHPLRPGPRILSLSFSPDGAMLASGDDWGGITFWDVLSGKERNVIGEGHQGPVSSISFTSNSSQLLTGSWDGTVRVWEVASGRTLLRYEGHEEIVTLVAEVPFSNYLVSGCARNTLRIWDRELRVEARRMQKPYPEFLAVSYARSFDGHSIAMTFCHGEPSAFILDARTGGENQRVEGSIHDLRFPAFSPDGKSLAVLHGGGVKFVDCTTGKVRNSLDIGGRSVQFLGFSPVGDILATTDDEGHVFLWDVVDSKALLSFASGVPNAIFAFSPDGKMLATAGPDNSEIRLWEVGSTNAIQTFVTDASGVVSMCFSPDGRRLASGNVDGTALIWDVVSPVHTGSRQKSDVSDDWGALLAESGPDVYRRMREMASRPKQIVPFLKEQLLYPKLRTEEVMRMVEGLDSDSPQIREKTERAIVEADVEPELLRVLDANISTEVRVRIQGILRAITRAVGRSANARRRSRALQILEWIGTPESRAILVELSEKGHWTQIRRDAGKSIERSMSTGRQ